MVDKAREAVTLPRLLRVVVSIDPSGARSADDRGADTIGIVVAALGADERGYVLADRSLKGSPGSGVERLLMPTTNLRRTGS